MKHRVCILLNRLEDYDFEGSVHRYLPAERIEVVLTESFPENPSNYKLIVPWNYCKIIKRASQAGNVIVMHASELPEGRGWAPIYHTFSERKPEYVISVILAADDVDTGDVVVRARFPIEASYTAPFVRELDKELSVLLIAKILDQWPNGAPRGVKQLGPGSFRPRRHPHDSEVDPSASLSELLPHLRGVESATPSYFYHDKVKYLIEVRPESKPRNPRQVTIEYPALDRVESWYGWQESP